TLNLSGTGNMKLMTNPEVKFPEDFETYDPQIVDDFSLSVNGLKGTRKIDFLAIPRYAGDFTIPAVSFTYYDTSSNRYQTISSESYDIHVEKGKGSAASPIMGSDFSGKEDLKVLGQDIRFIHSGNVSQQGEDDIWYGTMSYWSYYAILLLLLIITLLVYNKRISERADTNKMRTKRANKIALKRLNNAGKLRKSDNKEAFYDELLTGLWGYTSDKLNIPLSELNKDNVAEKLSSVSVSEQTVQRFLDLLSECEFARFAPAAAGENRVDSLYHEALEVIGSMENAIK
ncbi:MAG: BatD family protein, partial [Bacteroidaceae bacterium]